MTNSLRKLAKDLKAFAKRCKDFKYTEKALFVFLLCGIAGFADVATTTDQAIQNKRQEISTSIGDMRQEFRKVKAENNKLVKNYNLELIQLMEQGDHVVKSPWSSWQYGMNYFYNDWTGTYKGRGDKTPNVKYKRNSEDKFGTYTGGKYGSTTLNKKVIEPISAVPVDAAVKPKDIQKTALNINLPKIGAPVAPVVNVNAKSVSGVSTVSVTPPSVNLNLPNPDAIPFNDFSFTEGNIGARGAAHDNSTYWGGYNPNTGKLTAGGGKGTTETSSQRPPTVIDTGTASMNNVNVYVAGNVGGIGKATHNRDGEIGIHIVDSLTLQNVNGYLYGRGAFLSIETWHSPLVTLQNVEVNISSATPLPGWNPNNVAETPGENNTIFYIYPSTYENMTNIGRAKNKRGGFNGVVNADISTRKNVVYSVMGIQGGFNIDSLGEYNLIGANNTIYSGIGYSPDYDKIKKTATTNLTSQFAQGVDFKSSLKFTKTPKSYGDNNILMFFSNRIDSSNIAAYNSGSGTTQHINWEKSTVGIYQGEILAKGIIGEHLQKYVVGTPEPTSQTASGNTPYINGVATVQNANYVENNVGILAKSGQRGEQTINGQTAKLIPSTDLGANSGSFTLLDANDPIHSLQINDIDVSFGKYSKDSLMLVSQNGTVVDVAKTSNVHKTGDATLNTTAIRTTPITDYGLLTTGTLKASYTDTKNEVATGTIIALADGTWKNSVHGMFSTEAKRFEGQGSQVNIGQDVILSARYKDFTPTGSSIKRESYPIAYVAKDKGIVTTEGDTTAKGYGSIIAYAENGGEVKTGYDSTTSSYIANKGNIKAVDEWADKDDATTRKYLYKNIGGYAKSTNGTQTKITIKGKAEINGLGAVASGVGSEVYLQSSDNLINTSESGALAALDNGYIQFNGGKIVNENFAITTSTGTEKMNRSNTTPFYASGGGIIDFTNTGTTPNTTIEMATGLLKEGADSEYTANNATAPTLAGTTYNQASGTKYNGMKNVKVKLTGDDVVFNIVDNTTTNWTNTSSYLTDVIGANGMKLGAFDFNGKSYKSYYTNGIFNMTGTNTINLDNNSTSGLVVSGTPGNLTVGGTGSNEIEFNNITMEREIVNIGQNVTLNSSAGKGLAMASNTTATSNANSGYFNEGTINITGGASASNTAVGLNVSYGTIENKSTGKISVDEGVGIYGTNGSKLKNEGIINITTKGYGIVAKGTDPNIRQNYGTDKLTSLVNNKTVEIINNGTINLAGDKSIAIYAENNTNAPRTNVTVDNTSALTATGDEGIGIAVVASAPVTPGLPMGASAVTHGSTNQGGTITVASTGTGPDITVGVKGKGIYAQNSDINLTGGDYVVETKEGGIGIFASGNTNVTGTLEYKYNGSTTGTGMGIVYDSAVTNNANVKLTNATNTTGGMIGVYTTAPSGTFTNNGDITGSSTALEFGIVSDGANVINKKTITLGNAASQANANVGIYAKSNNTITNDTTGTINVGDNAIGIYGYNVINNKDIKAGDNGVAIYTQGTPLTTVDLNSGSTITVGKNQAVGVYAVGSGQNINANAGSSMIIGDNSFGIVNVGSGNTVTSNTTNPVTLGTDAVYIYQNDNTGTINNYTPLTSTGDRNYGLYGNGTINNNAVINFTTGNGNVGMYATTGGIATNNTGGVIKVGASNTAAKEFGVGMATGYYNEATGTISNQGTIINHGTIEVSQPKSMGMYAVGSGSKAINYGNINLSGSETVGMYIDRGAKGENWGTIQTTAGGLTGVKGVYVANGGYIKNYGTISIGATDSKSAGIWTDNADHAEENATGVHPITGASKTGTSTPAMKVATASDEKTMGGVSVKVPPRATVPTVTDAQGNVIPIFKVDTDVAAPAPTTAIVTAPSGITSINLATSNFLNFPSASEASSLGMYVDTSGVNYTNPIQGLSNLTGLTDINLFFGTEASRYTTARAIEVGDNILKPYNDALSGVVTAGTTLNVTAASLTWMAQPTKNAATGLLDKVYLVKIPYTMFANKDDKQTYNFLTGLEQKYGQEGLGTREKAAFDKINNLSGGEGHILAQAFDEMKGHQYSNIQQRTKETGDILSQEFNYLQDEWRNPTKDNNKIKMFGHRGEYNTDTAGVVDYTDNAYGVAYVHENETVKLGRKSGWYAGAVTNRFEFKDLGKSKETQTMVKAGLFKTVSPYNDHNGSLTWTIAGEAFAGVNNMTRRYWIVDDTFEAKSDYTTYGVALKNEIGKDFRTSERTSIRPYGALNLEYGRYSNIKEDGPMALEVKGNDYFSVQPELGVAFNYSQPVGVKSHFKASLTAAYTNELGEVNDVRNKARLKGTTADYYELRGDKEDRKGNGKFDLNIGFDNTRFGVTVNAGYDTKGENIRGGIGFRAIY